MFKNISNLGVALSRTEQKSIHGGAMSKCRFPDGTGWTLNFEHQYQANAADANCRCRGGETALM